MKSSFLGIAALGFASAASATPTLNHAWDLNNSTADALGGPALTLQGTAALGATGVNFFTGHNALSLNNALAAFTLGTDYSVEMYFQLASVSGYRRLINTSFNDNGFYNHNNQLDYYQSGAHDGGSTYAANDLLHVVFARGAAGTSVYLNGAFALSSLSYTSSAITSDMLFFTDDAAEESNGFVDFIRSYDYQLSAGDAATLYNNGTPLTTAQLIGSPGGVPEPATWSLMIGGFGLVGGAMRRRVTQVTYSI